MLIYIVKLTKCVNYHKKRINMKGGIGKEELFNRHGLKVGGLG